MEADRDNRVRVLPFDILSERFFNDGWLIERPWDPSSFRYTDDRRLTAEKPAFPENVPFACDYEEGKINLRFGQAVGAERPDAYAAVIRRVADGRIFAQKSVFSSYYLYEMPKEVAMKFEVDLPAGDYQVELTAVGFWNNRSDALVRRFTVNG